MAKSLLYNFQRHRDFTSVEGTFFLAKKIDLDIKIVYSPA